MSNGPIFNTCVFVEKAARCRELVVLMKELHAKRTAINAEYDKMEAEYGALRKQISQMVEHYTTEQSGTGPV